jgi:hypothetical protein
MRSGLALATCYLIIAAPALTAQKDKTYDLKLEPKPFAGQLTEESYTDSMAMHMSFKAGKKKAVKENQKQSSRFELTALVLETAGDEITKQKWSFKTARRLVEGKEVPFGFEGKTVIVTRAPSGDAAFQYENGTSLSGEDLEGIKGVKSSETEKKEEGKPDADEAFAPKTPVKPGQSWNPDMSLLAGSILDPENLADVDMKKSKGKMTLKAVKIIDGKEFAVITGKIDIYSKSFGPFRGDKPVLISVAVSLQVCADGSVPDGKVEMKMKIKGKTVTVPPGSGQSVDVVLDINAAKKGSVKTIKPEAKK